MPLEALFIPKKIRVGYQKREDTFTKRLAYVIYFDNKGKIRKEASWKSWVDSKIPSDDFDNVPTSGFVINKNIERYKWSSFGSGHSYIRIYDPRGIEFEITPENLIGILMNTTCSKRGLDGEFVYGWVNGKIVLLPVTSEEYQAAVTYTNLQDTNVSMKDLTAGCSYTTKKGDEVIYVGKYNWCKWNFYGGKRVSKMMHIFMNPKGKAGAYNRYSGEDPKFFAKNDVSFLAHCNNPTPVLNFAKIVDDFGKDIHSSSMITFETSPLHFDLSVKNDEFGRLILAGFRNKYTNVLYKMDNGLLQSYSIEIVTNYDHAQEKNVVAGFTLNKGNHNIDTKSLAYQSTPGQYRNSRDNVLSEPEMRVKLQELHTIHVVLESGKKVRVESLDDFHDDRY